MYLPPILRLEIYATCGEGCRKLSISEGGILVSEDVPDLHSDHMEADTRMYLHAVHADNSCPPQTDIIICTVDTDVFILGLWAATQLQNQLILLLTLPNNTRLLDMTLMC